MGLGAISGVRPSADCMETGEDGSLTGKMERKPGGPEWAAVISTEKL